MHDGITFEKAGKPAVTILTQEFRRLADAKKESMGMPSFGLVVVPHPLGTAEAARQKAEEALPQVVRVLTGQA